MAYYDQWGRLSNVSAQYQQPAAGTARAAVQPAVQTAANTATATSTAPTPGSAFDWRQGAWQVANRWNPNWAAQNAWNTITDPKTVVAALNAARPSNAGALGQWSTDLKYVNAGQGNTVMPSWYGISTQNPGSFTQPGTPSTNPGQWQFTPGAGVPVVDWSKVNWGTGATNPLSGGAGAPSWFNDPNWASNANYAKQAQTWAAVMVPWLQAQQNAYQYQQDANEAQRRYNLERAATDVQNQFTMDQAVKTAEYQKQRDAEEFKLGRQQVWGRNIAPNTKWMRSWS